MALVNLTYLCWGRGGGGIGSLAMELIAPNAVGGHTISCGGYLEAK